MNPKHYCSLSSNPNSLKSRFTRGFLRALIKIKKKQTPSTPASPRLRDIFQRCRRVQTAADKSLALAVGSRRAWSRALLWRIQYKAWRHHANYSVRRIYNIHPLMRSKKLLKEKKNKNKNKKRKEEEEESCNEDQERFCHAKELRKLVPGGEAMDLCSLLDETAHYIKCLATQVQVMKSIDEFYSI